MQSSSSTEPANRFLEEAYDSLGYQDGTLLDAVDLPLPGSPEAKHWLDKGDWLVVAQRVNASRVFFVENDPVIVFSQLDQMPDGDVEDELLNVVRRAWCMARPQYLFLALPGELRVYDLGRLPIDASGNHLKALVVDSVPEVLEKLKSYHRELLESGYLAHERRFGSPNERADRRLIRDLNGVRQRLEDTGLKDKYAYALIGRSIFIRYLEDRGVLTREYYERVAGGNRKWMALLSANLEKPSPIRKQELEKRFYYQVLLDKEFTYALFDQLRHDFNGDMFPSDDDEREAVEQKEHLDPLRRFLLGDPDQQQASLFFWAYDFDVVPIELISSIYEEFYHRQNGDENGTHYTPIMLVDFVLTQVLTKERLQSDPKILDPACGSGIFLVESFRRIVRYRVQRDGRLPTAQELRLILQHQIRGIEIDPGAAYVAAFSLYLALLHYQEPPDILAQVETNDVGRKPLPHLIFDDHETRDSGHYNVLFVSNAFALSPSERLEIRDRLSQKKRFAGRADLQRLLDADQTLELEIHDFDVVVGNPPWYEVGADLPSLPCNPLPPSTRLPHPFHYDSRHHSLKISQQVTLEHARKAKQTLPPAFHRLLEQLKIKSDMHFQAIRWAKAYDRTVGEGGYSQLFLHRALSFTRSSGIVGLLVHSNVLLSHRGTSQKFREELLSSCQMRLVFNFAHVRGLFFEEAVAPFVFISLIPDGSDIENHRFVYTSARHTKAAERSRAVILAQGDRRIVSQVELKHRDYLWKTYWWGSHRDAALLAALDTESQLRDILENHGIQPGYGYQRGGNDKPSPAVQNLPSLKSTNLTPHGPLEEEWFEKPPTTVKRDPPDSLYRGQRLIIARGTKVSFGVCARLEYDDFSFRHTIYCIPLPSIPAWQAKLILGTFWSSLGQYRLFMTSGTWGTWYDQVTKEPLLSMPIKLPQEQSPVTQRVVQVVDALRSWAPSAPTGSPPVGLWGTTPPSELAAELNESILALFELSKPEQELVEDWAKYSFSLFSEGPNSASLEKTRNRLKKTRGTILDLPSDEESELELESYLRVFLQGWNRELTPAGELRWQVVRSPKGSMLGVFFTTQEKGQRLLELPDAECEDTWTRALSHYDDTIAYPISRRVYIDGIVRGVTDTDIFIIKRDERRLWTRSMAREDVEATMLQAMRLQAKRKQEQ